MNKVQNYNNDIGLSASLCVCMCETCNSACARVLALQSKWNIAGAKITLSLRCAHTHAFSVSALGVKSIFQTASLPSEEWNAYYFIIYLLVALYWLSSLLFLCYSFYLVRTSYIYLYMHLFKVPHAHTHHITNVLIDSIDKEMYMCI